MLSNTEENYIKQVFSLEEEIGKEVSTNLIAKKMSTKASSVTDMIQRLASKKLVIYKKYKGASLTKKGRGVALSIVRKHRLWETFLVQKLDFLWDEVHEIAEQLEHIKSEKLTNNLDKFLGYPTVDPHGDPIPNVNGEITKIKTTCLTEFEVGGKGVFVGVKNASDDFLKYLSHNKIVIGCRIKVIYKEAFDHSIKIEINKNQFNISENVAKNLYLKS